MSTDHATRTVRFGGEGRGCGDDPREAQPFTPCLIYYQKQYVGQVKRWGFKV